MSHGGQLPVQAISRRAGFIAEMEMVMLLRETSHHPPDRSESISPKYLISPPRPPSATATACRAFATSSPTKTSLYSPMARSPALRIGPPRAGNPRSCAVWDEPPSPPRTCGHTDHRGGKSRIGPMLGLKRFRTAANTTAGIGLLLRIRTKQFHLSRLRLRDRRAPAVWDAVLAAQ
jgi:hypothetical protein